MTTPNTDDGWTSCPSGTLRSIPGGFPQKSRREFLTGVAAGAVVGGLGIGISARYRHTQSPGGLACADCVDLFAAFARSELAQRVSYRVEVHLAACSHCRSQYESQYG